MASASPSDPAFTCRSMSSRRPRGVAARPAVARSGSTASCCTSWSGATSRFATSRPRSASAWAVLQPLLDDGGLQRCSSAGSPGCRRTACRIRSSRSAALLPWQLFAFALTESSNSVVANQRLITKVYFPRLILPLAALGVGLVDFAVAFVHPAVAHAGLLRRRARLAVLTVPLWALLAVRDGAGRRPLALGAERPLPRRALHACRS